MREKEHERCGGHLVGPLLVTNAVAGVLANRAPERYQGPARLARAAVVSMSVGASYTYVLRLPRARRELERLALMEDREWTRKPLLE